MYFNFLLNKKSIVFTVIFVLTLMLVNTLITTSVSEAKDKVYIRIVSGTVGGAFFPASNVIAALWNEKLKDQYNIFATGQSSAGTSENLAMLNNKEAEVAILAVEESYYAYYGQNVFEGNPYKGLRIICNLWTNPTSLVVLEKSGINTLSEFRGRRVSVGASGGSTDEQTLLMLNAAGMTFKDIEPEYLGYGQTVDAMKDGKIVAAQMSGGLPFPSVLELFSSPTKVKMISLTDEEVEYVTTTCPFYTKFIIPAGTYPNQDYDVQTVTTEIFLGVRDDVDEEIVYALTKTIFENLDRLTRDFGVLKSISPKSDNFLPLHSGAERYYKEVGLEIPKIITPLAE